MQRFSFPILRGGNRSIFTKHNPRYFSKESGLHHIKRDPRYAEVSKNDIDYFSSFLPAKSILTSQDDIAPYNVDWMKKWTGSSSLLLRPTSTEQLSKILSYCNEKKLAVVPQGGNTGLVGGSIPIFDEIIVNMSEMNSILEFDPIQGIVTVEAGCILEVLSSYLQDHGFIAPIDLGAKGSCHIGGNAATAAGGLRYVRYGSLRGTILGIEAVLPDGTVLDVLNTLRKDNTGLDLKQLFIGSEGTLGIITKLAILCPPKPTSVSVAYLGLPSFQAVLDTMSLARKHCMETISAIEFQDRDSLNLVLKHVTSTRNPLQDDSSPYYFLVEISGGNESHNREKLEQFLEAVFEQIPHIQGTVSESEEQAMKIWKLRECVAEGASKEGYVFKYDISLPVVKMEDFVTKVRHKVAPLGASVVGYGHLGDGNLHINVMLPHDLPNLPQQVDAMYAVLEPWIFEELQIIRGSISAEHGLGQAKNSYIQYSKSPLAVNIMQNVKHMFDPNGILNPYKFLPVDTNESHR